MKQISSFLAVLISTAMLFCGCTSVQESGVGKQEIEDRLLYNKISNASYRGLFKDSFGEQWKMYYEPVELPETAEEVRDSILEDIAICRECKKKGILIDRDTAEKTAATEFENLKTDSSQSHYAEYLLKALSEYGLTEAEYGNLVFEYAYYHYNRAALRAYFQNNMYSGSEQTSLDEQFEKYLNTIDK